MADEIVKASIVFGPSGGGIAGAAGGSTGGSTGGGGQGNRAFGKAMNLAVTLPITDVLGGIAKGVEKLVAFSPLLMAENIRFQKGLQLMLMPIGNIMANNLRPFTNAWLKSARKFYADYESGGLIAALAGAIGAFFSELGWVDASGNISLTGILENVDELTAITGTLLLSGAAIAGGISLAALMVKNIKGMKMTSAGKLGIAGVLMLTAAELTEGGMDTLIANVGIAALVWGPGFVKIAGALILSKALFEDEWDDASQWVINSINDLGEEAGKVFWGVFGQQGILSNAIGSIGDFIFGRDEENTMIADLDSDTLTLGEHVEGMPPIWERAWNSITDSLGLTVTPALDDMGIQLDDNDSKVGMLANALIALPNINRTITYTIKYVTQGSR
jgi:hypothetical protein